MKQYKVAAIIVTYNRDEYLKDLIENLLLQSYPVEKIIVIDNANSEIINDYKINKDKIIYHKNNKNEGCSKGFKKGLEIALELDVELFWLFDDDVVPQNTALEELIKIYHNNEVIQPIRINLKNEIVEISCLEFDLKSILRNNPRKYEIRNIFKNLDKIPNKLEIADFTFEGVLIPKTIVVKVGLPNPNFFIFCDDTEYALRIRKAGYKIYLIKNSVIFRKLEYKNKIDDWKEYFLNRNMYYLYKFYGENKIIKIKPFVHFFLKIFKLIFRLQFKRIKRLFYSFYDFMKKEYPIRIIE
ncbi:MAG TPA: glycosyltransferase [Ignavibacteriales bacterium]|jgi:GT2 family glycosyltransferase|nr:glycosyltransferase [Ignavibacteriales bacterium]